MDHSVGVQVGKCQGDVVSDVHLDVVRKWVGCALQEVGQTFFHQLHQQNGPAVARILNKTKELNNAGVLQFSEQAALLVKTSGKVLLSRIIRPEENLVEDFCCTWQVV